MIKPSIHPAPSSFVHCKTIDCKLIALPARTIQYYNNVFTLAPNGHWFCGIDSKTLLKSNKRAFELE